MSTPERLTDRTYWETYYQNHNAMDTQNLASRIMQKTECYAPLFRKLDLRPRASLLELGGFPGRIGARLASQFKASIHAIDFNPNVASFYTHCKALEVQDCHYTCSDFFELPPEPIYDLVFSVGLIEHFSNFQEVMDVHASWTKPGGQIMIVMPNHRKLAYVYRRIFDAENLAHHNLQAMNIQHFETMAKRLNLELQEKGFFGPFLTNPHQQLAGVRKLIHRPVHRLAKLFNPLIERHPHPWFSANLYGLLRKP